MHFNGKLEFSLVDEGCAVAVENLPTACGEDDLFDSFYPSISVTHRVYVNLIAGACQYNLNAR